MMGKNQSGPMKAPIKRKQPMGMVGAPKPLRAVIPATRQAAGSQIQTVPAAAQVQELVQTIQSPMGPLQIVTKQVNGKMVQLIRFNKTEPKGPSNLRKLLLAAIPGFFGVMGLSQLYQGKKVKGAAFLAGGLVASFVSSWYTIIPARLQGLFTHGAPQPAYALSFLSSLNINASLASKLSVDLMGVVAVVWALQLFDAMGPFFTKQNIVSVAATASSKAPIPLPLPAPAVRRAITPTPNPSFMASESKPVA